MRGSWLRPFTSVLVLGAIFMVAGCSRALTVESTWGEGMEPGASFSNVLVVAVTTDYNIRCRFERVMAASLRSDTVKATASCAEMDSKEPLTRDNVIPVVKSTGADAVLVTELLGRTGKMVEGGSRENRSKAYYKPAGYGYAYYGTYYGAFGLPVTYVDFTAEQSAFSLERTVGLASNLFETSNARLVYAMHTTARDQPTPEDVLDVTTLGISERLRRDGLVR